MKEEIESEFSAISPKSIDLPSSPTVAMTQQSAERAEEDEWDASLLKSSDLFEAMVRDALDADDKGLTWPLPISGK